MTPHLLAVLGLPWWGWVLVFVVVILWNSLRVWRAFCRKVRQEFIELLHEKHPDYQVVAETREYLDIERPNPKDATQPETGRLFLRRVYDAASSVKDQTVEGRRQVLEQFADLSLMNDLEGMNFVTHGDKIFPRIVNEATLQELNQVNPLPSEPLGDTGLHVVCVIDGAHQVAYLIESNLEDFAADFATLKARSLENLARNFDHTLVRKAVMAKEVTMVEMGDSYDAARLLLVPQHMIPGETLVAMIPDRDTLVLSPLPANGNWGPIEQLARSPRTDRPIANRPLKVTSQGVAAV